MHSVFWVALLAWAAQSGSVLAAPPVSLENLERRGHLEVGSNGRSGDLVSFNLIDFTDYEVERDGGWVLDMAWKRSRVTLSCDWRMIVSDDYLDGTRGDIAWPVADVRDYGGSSFVPSDGPMAQLFQRYCLNGGETGDTVAFDKLIAGMRARLPMATGGPLVQPRPQPGDLAKLAVVVKAPTPVPDQHFWDFGPASWRRLEGLPPGRGAVFVNAARVMTVDDTRSAWVFIVPPPLDPEDADITRDAAMRQYKIDCTTGNIELIGETVWWATGGSYPESVSLRTSGPALAGSLTGRLSDAVCGLKFGTQTWPSMDEAYKSIVGRSRWFW